MGKTDCQSRWGKAWGAGSYFARDASYVVNTGYGFQDHPKPGYQYVIQTRNGKVRSPGHHKIFLNLAMTGLTTAANANYGFQSKLPTHQDGIPYDSTVDDMSAPEVHVLPWKGTWISIQNGGSFMAVGNRCQSAYFGPSFSLPTFLPLSIHWHLILG